MSRNEIAEEEVKAIHFAFFFCAIFIGKNLFALKETYFTMTSIFFFESSFKLLKMPFMTQELPRKSKSRISIRTSDDQMESTVRLLGMYW